jgi:RNA ligase (TIGR02306 family)
MRKLATIRRIEEVIAIEGADKICAYGIGGWKVVDQVGKYKVNDLVVFCEVDSWVPTTLAPFLSKGKEPRVFEGIQGERLRTIKLRGQLSQGLLMPLTVLSDNGHTIYYVEDIDVTEILGIVKWEKPINAQLAGVCKGNFPSLIPKTDQERVQNLKKEITAAFEAGLLFELTEKLEGSSMTCYLIDGEFGVCSRNMDLKRDENNSFWRTAIENDIENKMREIPEGEWAIQGELIGPGIQGNIYNLTKTEFRVFDVYNIKSGEYLLPMYRRPLILRMGLEHAPIITVGKDLGTGTIDELLTWAEGESELANVEREGIVFKQENGGMTFKAISNKYLLGEK